ncbi:MAG: PD-(D/E)XK nuclease family protein [Proteobacteria bacterium]|nr:PD-(D/E)XK nuclease family protein [Pseudomonadota bacterium]
MTESATTTGGAGSAPHPALALWTDPRNGLIGAIADAVATAQARVSAGGNRRPVQAVVLLPYLQLLPLVQKLWAERVPSGFAPRFETTQTWARSAGAFVPGPDDITFDAARDALTARALLERAGLGGAGQSAGLAGRMVEQAQQLATRLAAEPLLLRSAWLARARAAIAPLHGTPLLAYESALARIALEWAAASRSRSDALFAAVEQGVAEEAGATAAAAPALDCLVVLEGLQPDPLAQALAAAMGERAVVLPLCAHDAPATRGAPELHAARDLEDEAQRAAACVLRHIAAGRMPVALVATDRVLTRRVRAMLDGQGVAIRDESGWTLSTTRAAAHVMGALRACRWDASSDTVLDWLKNAPAFAQGQVLLLERTLRKAGIQRWRAWSAAGSGANEVSNAALTTLTKAANDLMQTLQRPRALPQWLQDLAALLQASGQWSLLAGDAAGDKLLAVLRLDPIERAALQQSLAPTVWASRRLDLAEFTAWVDDALEAASFVPPHPQLAGDEQAVILPMAQLLARPFAAVVLPGCDELRLPASPEPPGPWSAAQRRALGLPPREALEQAQRAAWHQALQAPRSDVLWRQSDDTGEPLLPSLLVQELLLEGLAQTDADPREQRAVPSQPAPRPLPVAPDLPVQRLSASAYEDLRRCPYRFFALRQLGLQEAEELEGELDKRDFGLWLHAVLKTFHEALKAAPAIDLPSRVAMLDVAAGQATETMRLGEDEFLPFAAAWPQVRDGYLAWLATHEATGAVFEQAEAWQEQPLGRPDAPELAAARAALPPEGAFAPWGGPAALTLIGRIDRIDRCAASEPASNAGQALLIDYKTEALPKSRERVRQPTEDTQLAFYAALLPDDALRAAYVNVGEKGVTTTVEQPAVVQVRDALIAGILHDLRRIAAGAALPALGEGSVCDTCAARGLCRKDFWDAA